jgi:hypothetical protein
MEVEVYIGDLSDPEFDYENGNWSGNIPKRISDFFPDPHTIFFGIVNKIEKGELTGKQTDWGSWTAILYPSEITDVIKELYGAEACTKNKYIRSVLIFVKQLDNEKQFGLVACEIG